MSRILIVDDQNDIRRLIRMSLELDDHEIHEASDGAQGLALAQALRPDLILMDVMMPGGVDGLQACRELKADPASAAIPSAKPSRPKDHTSTTAWSRPASAARPWAAPARSP